MADDVVLYHNPKCSKSRGALEILRDNGVDFGTVEYLNEPLSAAQLKRVLAAIDDPPSALVRRDPRFKELGLNIDDYQTAASVVKLLVAHPELMERPVVMRGNRAVIGRPPEKVLDLL